MKKLKQVDETQEAEKVFCEGDDISPSNSRLNDDNYEIKQTPVHFVDSIIQRHK